MNERLHKLSKELDALKLDAILVSTPANITYLTKYPSRDSYFLASRKGNIYFTDLRYTEEAQRALKDIAIVRKANGSVFELIASSSRELKLVRLAFEERYLPYAEYNRIKKEISGETKIIPSHGIIEALRQVKEPSEIAKMKKAVQITGEALRHIKKFIKPGTTELEVVAELERFIRYFGATNSAFDIIVASGPNSSLPHHIPGYRKIRNNELVLIDLGIDYHGYKSDLTRVFFLGKIKVLLRQIHSIVAEAQRRAIAAVKPGVKAAKVDAAGRQYIGKKGFAHFFGHSLGHGIGLEVHEQPGISAKENCILRPGMIFTVEPGIYLPGKFGVRIEDMVLVTQKGVKVLSGAIN
ncbi:MAG: Xaa-Pro peptidase family protein [Candidatus Omnitrophota bacterium]|jgi:Xaa-Pro aminopeptidase